jgi:hypothetical protein
MKKSFLITVLTLIALSGGAEADTVGDQAKTPAIQFGDAVVDLLHKTWAKYGKNAKYDYLDRGLEEGTIMLRNPGSSDQAWLYKTRGQRWYVIKLKGPYGDKYTMLIDTMVGAEEQFSALCDRAPAESQVTYEQLGASR